MAQAKVCAQRFHGFLPVGDSPGVAPDDGRAQGFLCAVYTYQAVHLVTDTDGGQPFFQGGYRPAGLFGGSGHGFGRGTFQVVPPRFGFLFRPPGLQAQDGSFLLGVKGCAQRLSGLRVHHTSLDRRAAYVISYQIHNNRCVFV